jgi:hypothetical protein
MPLHEPLYGLLRLISFVAPLKCLHRPPLPMAVIQGLHFTE